ncbi:hypothetical protein D3C84_839020 [compost metagenome]
MVGQGLHQATGHLHIAGEGADGVDRVADPLLPKGRRLTGLTRGIGGGNRIARDFFHGGGHFGHGGGGLFQFLILLAQAVGALFGDVLQHLGGLGHLRGVAGELTQGGALALLHMGKIGE